MADEIEAGKTALLALIGQLDAGVQVVIPVRATNDRYLISLTKGKAREFISISEDDLLDVDQEPTVRREVEATVRAGLAKLGG
ncbi:MAG: hypothetical protein HY208_01110 [Nitrospirae bacterium]|nr:hypothetical protein [Nitrospirota bacterium]